MAVLETCKQERSTPAQTGKTTGKERKPKATKSRRPPKLTLLQKLLEIRKSVTSIDKDVQGVEFSYPSHAKVMESVREKMDELGVLLVPETLETTAIKNGEHQVKAKMKFTWINVEKKDDTLEIAWIAYGANIDISRAMGVLTTYAVKDFILKQFQIPQNNQDPDAKGNKPKKCNCNPVMGPGYDHTYTGGYTPSDYTPITEAGCNKKDIPTAPPKREEMVIQLTEREIREKNGLSPDPICLKDMGWVEERCRDLETPASWEYMEDDILSDGRYRDFDEITRRAIHDHFIELQNKFAKKWNAGEI